MPVTFRDRLRKGSPYQDFLNFDEASQTSAEEEVQSAIANVCKALIRFIPPPGSKPPTKKGGQRRDKLKYHTGTLDLRSLRVAANDDFNSTLDGAPFHLLVRRWMSGTRDRKDKDLGPSAGLRKPDGCLAVWTVVPFPTASDIPSLVPPVEPEPSDAPSWSSQPPHPSSTAPSTSPATRASAQASPISSGKTAAKRPSSRNASSAGRSAGGNSNSVGRSAGGNSAGRSVGGNSAVSTASTTLAQRVGAAANEAVYCSVSLVTEVKPVTKPLSELYARLLCYLVSTFEVCNCRFGVVVRGARWGRVAIVGHAQVLVEVKERREGTDLLGGVEEFFAGLGAPDSSYSQLPRDLSVVQEGKEGEIWKFVNPGDFDALCATFMAAADCLADLTLGERIWRLPDPPLAAPSTSWGAV
ncbi:hypothetical protein IAT38_001956 [Cryptococcus sp. DSM 104549]